MSGGSVVVRRSLGRRLKQLRQQAGKTWKDVDTAHIASRTKLHRIENSTAPVHVPDVQALCLLYGVDEATRRQLVEQAVNAGGPSWWEDYTDVMPSWFGMYVELESSAATLTTWSPVLIHGLLQTTAYQHALFETYPDMTATYADRQVRLRSERQRAAFDSGPPLQVVAIIDEGVLRREVGGAGVMAEQVDHLVEVSKGAAPVRVHVLPWTAGAHVAMKGAFSILGFESDDDPDVVYLETDIGGRYVEQPVVVDRYRGMFEAIRATSIPIEEYR